MVFRVGRCLYGDGFPSAARRREASDLVIRLARFLHSSHLFHPKRDQEVEMEDVEPPRNGCRSIRKEHYKMSDRHDDGPIFNDPNWEKLRAPVVPFAWVVEKLKRTGRAVEWENGENREHDNSLPSGNRNWLMRYRTEYEGEEIVTRLLPGSAQPVEGWLR